MSKDVEVTGIQMTATVPETVQISLGYGQNSGYLTAAGDSDGVGLVKAPEDSDMSLDWSNTVAFYDYYKAPKLVPASSTTGASIFTTDDATGVGKTVDSSGTATVATAGNLTLITSSDTATSAVTTPTDTTGDYIDFPVWFRTSSSSDVTLSVKATVIDGTNSSAVTAGSGEDTLYQAARVSILTSSNGTATPATSAGVIIPFEKSGDTETGQTTAKYYASGKALNSAGALGTQGTGAAYGDVDAITQTTKNDSGTVTAGETVVTLKGKSGSGTVYSGNSTNTSDTCGDATCVIVRVWLEGEDTNCWNATAGQDFQIALAFSKNT